MNSDEERLERRKDEVNWRREMIRLQDRKGQAIGGANISKRAEMRALKKITVTEEAMMKDTKQSKETAEETAGRGKTDETRWKKPRGHLIRRKKSNRTLQGAERARRCDEADSSSLSRASNLVSAAASLTTSISSNCFAGNWTASRPG